MGRDQKVVCLVQLNLYGAPYVAGVVGGHLAFALLEKKRLENFRETGQVLFTTLGEPLAYA
jgi:hypothetical protein